jgi:hypothetical protein
LAPSQKIFYSQTAKSEKQYACLQPIDIKLQQYTHEWFKSILSANLTFILKSASLAWFRNYFGSVTKFYESKQEHVMKENGKRWNYHATCFTAIVGVICQNPSYYGIDCLSHQIEVSGSLYRTYKDSPG